MHCTPFFTYAIITAFIFILYFRIANIFNLRMASASTKKSDLEIRLEDLKQLPENAPRQKITKDTIIFIEENIEYFYQFTPLAPAGWKKFDMEILPFTNFMENDKFVVLSPRKVLEQVKIPTSKFEIGEQVETYPDWGIGTVKEIFFRKPPFENNIKVKHEKGSPIFAESNVKKFTSNLKGGHLTFNSTGKILEFSDEFNKQFELKDVTAGLISYICKDCKNTGINKIFNPCKCGHKVQTHTENFNICKGCPNPVSLSESLCLKCTEAESRRIKILKELEEDKKHLSGCLLRFGRCTCKYGHKIVLDENRGFCKRCRGFKNAPGNLCPKCADIERYNEMKNDWGYPI